MVFVVEEVFVLVIGTVVVLVEHAKQALSQKLSKLPEFAERPIDKTERL